MGTLGARHYNTVITRMEQGQIVWGISQRDHVHIPLLEFLFQRVQGCPFASAGLQQVAHAIALHHCQVEASCFLLHQALPVAGWIQKRHAPLASLGHLDCLPLQSRQVGDLLRGEILQRL